MKKIIGLGEILLRMQTKVGRDFENLSELTMSVGGSEANVIRTLSNLEIKTSFLSAISNDELGTMILRDFRQNGVNTENIESFNQRNGIYFVNAGHGKRFADVIYDRANSAFTSWEKKNDELYEIIRDYDYLLISGITLAVNKNLRESLFEVLAKLKNEKTKIVLDINYRAKLWSLKESKETIEKLLPYIDYLSAGILDGEKMFGYKLEGESHQEKLIECYEHFRQDYPNLLGIFSTKRLTIDYSNYQLQAFYFDCNRQKLYTTDEVNLNQTIDRIGTGDAFMSGMLYGLIKGNSFDEIVNYGLTLAIYNHYEEGDYSRIGGNKLNSYLSNDTLIRR